MSIADRDVENKLAEVLKYLAQPSITIPAGLLVYAPIIEKQLSQILQEIQDMAATIKDVQAKVAAQTTIINSVITLLAQISQALKDAQANNDPAAVQGVIDMIDANDKALADAVQANTPGGGGGNPPPPTP